MTKHIGRRVNLGLARETARGTAVAAQFWMPKSAVAFFDKASKHQSKQSYNNIGDGVYAPKIMEWAEGSIDADIDDRSFGLLLYALFGSYSVAGPTDSAYTHSFILANTNQHTSLTLTLQDPDREDLYSLGMLDTLDIDLKPDEVATIKAEFKARSGRSVAIQTPSYSAANKFLGRHASIKIATLTSGLNAATALSVKGLKMKFNKNVLLNNILGTVWPDDILNQKFEITGELTLDLDDQTYRQLMLDGSYRALRVSMVNSDVLIGATSQPTFTLDLSRAHFEDWTPERKNDDIVTQKISFRALYDLTNSDVVHACSLINNVAAY